MTMKERVVWAQLLVFPLVAAVYLAVTLPRLADAPAEEIEWIAPMLWSMGAIVVGIIGGTIASAIGTGIRAEVRGEKPEFEEGDARDEEIERYGKYRGAAVTGWAGLAVIILAMVDAAPYWIATTMFMFGIAAGIFSAALQLRAYRRGL